jgi:hypothetical protein
MFNVDVGVDGASERKSSCGNCGCRPVAVRSTARESHDDESGPGKAVSAERL